MFFKIFFALTVILISLLMGISYRNRINDKLNLFYEYKSFLDYLNNKTVYFKKPVIDSIKEYINEYSFSTQKLEFLIGQVDRNGFHKGWTEYIEKYSSCYSLKPSEKRLLNYPGQFLGQSDSDSQINHFDQLNKWVNERISVLENELVVKGNSYIKIWTFGGVTLAMIII